MQHLGRSHVTCSSSASSRNNCRYRSYLDALNILPQAALFTSVGTTILEQLGILFAIGVAIGMAKKNDGAVALAAALGFL